MDVPINDQKTVNPCVHNLKVALMASLLQLLPDRERNPMQLTNYLNGVGIEPHYTPEYCFHVCQNANIYKACVILYAKLKLYFNGVSYALQNNDEQMAKEVVNAVKDPELKKRLLVQILRHLIEYKPTKGSKGEVDMDLVNNNRTKAIEFLHLYPNEVHLDDILKILPDDMILQPSHFGEIQKALEKYRAETDELKSELRDATNDSDTIRHELDDAKYSFMDVSKSTKCTECRDGVLYPAKKQLFENKSQEILLPSKFYSFSCGHHYHVNCLCALTLNLLNAKQSILKKLGLKETQDDVFADLFEDKTKEYDYREIEERIEERCGTVVVAAGKIGGIGAASTTPIDFQKELSDYCVLDEVTRKYKYRNKSVDIKRSKLSKLQRKINQIQQVIHKILDDNKDRSMHAELDDVIGKTCPYDSKLFVDLIQLPIVEDHSKEQESWSVITSLDSNTTKAKITTH